MATAKEVFDTARAVHLNDRLEQVYNNDALLPHLQEAHRDLQVLLWLNGIPVLKEQTSAIAVVAGNLSLTLPSDFVEPIWLKEKLTGSSDYYENMVECPFLPDRTQVISLVDWCFREEVITFVGATTDRDVQLRYWKTLTTPQNEDSSMGFKFAEMFLAPQTAQYAARSLGSVSLADDLLNTATQRFDMVLRANVKGLQSMPARRIPYHRRRKRILTF